MIMFGMRIQYVISACLALGLHILLFKNVWRFRVAAFVLVPIALEAKKESSDDDTLTSRSDDEEYAMVVRNFKFFRRKGKFVRQPREEKTSFRQWDDKKSNSDRKFFRCGDPNHLTGECLKPPQNKDRKAFVRGCWKDSENEAEEKINDETCLMAKSSNEILGTKRLSLFLLN
nr:alpha/beta hydrolases superfamily protein [Tanacetum cinerariifolium]